MLQHYQQFYTSPVSYIQELIARSKPKSCVLDPVPTTILKQAQQLEVLVGCRDGAVVRALASHQCGPGSISQIRRQMWAEFVGFLLCTERFSPGTPVSPLLKNQNLT